MIAMQDYVGMTWNDKNMQAQIWYKMTAQLIVINSIPSCFGSTGEKACSYQIVSMQGSSKHCHVGRELPHEFHGMPYRFPESSLEQKT